MKITKICYETDEELNFGIIDDLRQRMDFVPCVINLQFSSKDHSLCVTFDQELCAGSDIDKIMREKDY